MGSSLESSVTVDILNKNIDLFTKVCYSQYQYKIKFCVRCTKR